MSVFSKNLIKKMLDADYELKLREAAIRRRLEKRVKYYEDIFSPPKFDREKEMEELDFLTFKQQRWSIR